MIRNSSNETIRENIANAISMCHCPKNTPLVEEAIEYSLHVLDGVRFPDYTSDTHATAQRYLDFLQVLADCNDPETDHEDNVQALECYAKRVLRPSPTLDGFRARRAQKAKDRAAMLREYTEQELLDEMARRLAL